MRRPRGRRLAQAFVCISILLCPALPARAAPPARLDHALERALARPVPAEGIAIGVTLSEAGLPLPGSGRADRVRERQQRVLDALPAGSLRLKRRYESLAGFGES